MKTKRFEHYHGFSSLDLLLTIVALAGILLVIWPAMTKPRNPRGIATGIHCINNLKYVGIAFRIWAVDNDDKFPTQVSSTNGGAMELAQQGSAYAVFLIMSNELVTPKNLFCPDDDNPKRVAADTFGSTLSPGGSSAPIPFTATNNLSYFAGLDGNDGQTNAIISGDDHLLVGKIRARPGLLLFPTNTPVAWAKGRHANQGNIKGNPGGKIGMADGSVLSTDNNLLQRAFDNTGVATNRLAMP